MTYPFGFHCTAPAITRSTIARITILGLLFVTLTACGVDSDTVTKVDDAVKLLQDIEQDSTWEVISDGLDILADYDGYQATMQIEQGRLNAEGQPDTPPETITLLTIEVDAAGTARYTLEKPESESQTIFAFLNTDDADAPPLLVLEENSGYSCAPDDLYALLNKGPQSVFDSLSTTAIGIKTLSVVEETDEKNTISDREATRYILESKLDDALNVLEQTGNEDLRERIAQANTFVLSGTLDRDDETGALLHFDSNYTDTDGQLWQHTTFTVTSWQDTPAFSRPNDDFLSDCRTTDQ